MSSRRSGPSRGLQLPLFAPATDAPWAPVDLNALPSWKGVARIGYDTETCDPDLRGTGIGVRRGGFMAGISFAFEDGPKFYLPFGHLGGDNLPRENVLAYVREQAKTFDGILVGANLSYDLEYSAEAGIDFPAVKFFRDVQIADPVINELHDSYSLKNILERHGLPGKNEELLRQAALDYGVDPKGGLWKLPARFVTAYAEDDAAKVLPLLRKQERIIDEEDLWRIYDLESRVLPILVKMRRRGVRISEERLEGVERWSLAQEAEALDLVRVQTGIRIGVGDVWKPEAIAPALEAIGMTLQKTSSGKPSIDKEALGEIDHPVTKAIAWARKTNKLRTTFAASVRKYITNGRIHPTFNQMAREDDETGGDMKGARYGRLSSVHPNIQQQPARDEFAKTWRSIYLPEEGALWASKDYSQQEPRWTTHLAATMKLPMAEEAARRYRDDPSTDNHSMMAELTGLPRKQAKNIFLGLCYGEGGAKLCDDIGLPTRWACAIKDENGKRSVSYHETEAEAWKAGVENPSRFVWRAAGADGQAILDEFDRRCPYVGKLAKKATEVAKSRGYIITIGGRHLHFPKRNDGTFDWTHKALNRIIQGSSADQVKEALVAIDGELPDYFLQLQIHDEVTGSVATEAEARRAAAIMTNVREALVPFKVDVEVGASWGESMS